jgi:3-oxoacyl-[acyl-carrier protein] reductase
MEINLRNKTAWIFGGSRGIGQAIAIELAKAGANILLIARKKVTLYKSLELLCTQQQQKHDILSIDMNDLSSLTESLKSYRNLNNVDILINNSGGPNGGLAHTAEWEEYANAFKQHLLAAQVATQIVLPVMKKKQFGRIVNIISTSVKQPIPGLGVSNTIRGAVANWSKTLASEVGQFGITVNNILPGATKTARLDELITKKATNNFSEEEVRENMKSVIPLGRFAEPEELGYLVTFLSSKYANYINGINIPVDGGRTKSL